MEASTSPRGRLRRLAELRPERGRVLSLYFDLDPSTFPSGRERAIQITSLLDEAGKEIEGRDDLDRDERLGLREDVERIRGMLEPQRMASGGARGMAVFACAPAGILEVIRTPYPLDQRVVINHTPYIEPLATAGEDERFCAVLVSRRDGRIFLGDQHGLEELENVQDDTKGQHEQGGWSQRRYEETIENEKRDHLHHVADRLLALLRQQPFDRLIVGGPDPIDSEFEGRLHPYLQERLAGRLSGVDVEVATTADVLEAAKPVIEHHRKERERQVIERLRGGLGRGPGGRAVAGLPDVLAALNEQRVEVLLLEPSTTKRGWVDPQTGYLAAEPGPSPTDGELQEADDVIEAAIERAVEQSAEVLVLRDHPDLGSHGGVAALLRF